MNTQNSIIGHTLDFSSWCTDDGEPIDESLYQLSEYLDTHEAIFILVNEGKK